MNALDIHNYGMILIAMVGISSIPALIAKYDEAIIRAVGDIVLP
jgi:hypothetical protein